MSFGLSMHTCGVSSLHNHAEALAFYNSCRIKRGRLDTDERPIRGKERSNMGASVAGDGSVRFRYHNTDVVTWRPDNSFLIKPWSSQSTCTFANVFLPFRTYMTKGGTILVHGDHIHPLRGDLTVYADGRVEQQYPDTAFGRRRTDRRKGREALARTRYAEYLAWHNVMWPMVQGSGARRSYDWAVEKQYRQHLADENLWHDLMMSYAGDPNSLRKSIYRDAGDVFYTEYVDTLPVDTKWHNLNHWRVTSR